MTNFTGVVDDKRSQEEKNKDYHLEEVVALGGYVWKNFVQSEIPDYGNRDQNGSGMCGPFSVVTALGINNKNDPSKELEDIGVWLNLDPRFVYNLRTNKGPGMYMPEMLQIACDYGAPKDPNLSGDKLTEAESNIYAYTEGNKKEAAKFKGKSYVFMADKSIDNIAQMISMGYTPIILLRCTSAEYSITPTVGPEGQHNDINHYLPLIYAGIKDGVKTLVGKESWGAYNKGGVRYITEEFLDKRVERVGYIIDWTNNSGPKYTFTKPLAYGLMNNPDVRALQDILKFEGCMDQNVPSTGNYLNITAQSIMKLQLKNQISDPANIKSLQGKKVGPLTLKYLQKYA